MAVCIEEKGKDFDHVPDTAGNDYYNNMWNCNKEFCTEHFKKYGKNVMGGVTLRNTIESIPIGERTWNYNIVRC